MTADEHIRQKGALTASIATVNKNRSGIRLQNSGNIAKYVHCTTEHTGGSISIGSQFQVSIFE